MVDFNLKQDYFEHQSYLHGIMHTYRVMYNIKLLAAEHQLPDITYRTAFCAAFIHDMSRRHDGDCSSHGSWAVKEKLPVFRDIFKKYGLTDANLHSLKTSVIFHSLPQELPKSHPHYLVTALLKDGDALDRIRLGTGDLDPSYLRLPKSKKLIGPAEDNFFITQNIISNSWEDFIQILKENQGSRC